MSMWHPVNLSTFCNPGRTLYFGGGGSPPPAPPPAQAPTQTDAGQGTNDAATQAARKNGLRKTLLQDMATPPAQGTLGSSTLLGGGS